MSGTYELDGTLFPTNPLEKRWARRQVGTSGVGAPIFGPYWEFEMQFGTLKAATENAYFMAYYLTGGLHTVKVPHPFDGSLTTFTGVAIKEADFRFDDIERDSWAVGSRVVFSHINLTATGT